jgi:hypothetical protein
MSDTPETDGITFKATQEMMPPYDTVPSAFARRIERERDEARDRCRTLDQYWHQAGRESDQWRECAETLFKRVRYWMNREDDWCEDDEKAVAEFERLQEDSK